jgi:hypothetical protein
MQDVPPLTSRPTEGVCDFFGSGRLRKYDGAPTSAIRMSGTMRTVIMSFATCSPLRTLAFQDQRVPVVK